MSDLQPLSSNFQIVDEKGLPTRYFIEWAQQRQIDISGGITAEQAQELIDTWAAQRDITAGVGLVGGGSLSVDITIDLEDTAVAPNTYGDATHVGQFTVDQQGRIISAASVLIAGGGGGFVKIDEVITSGSQATIAFAAIPNTFRSLRLVVNSRCNVVANNGELYMQFNGDTANNYDWIVENRFGTASGNAVANMRCGDPNGTLAAANYANTVIIDIPDYINPIFYKSIASHSDILINQTLAGMFQLESGGWWRSTAVVTDILLSLNAGGTFIDGSVASLYGIA